MLCYKPVAEVTADEPEEEMRQPATAKLKKRLPSANKTGEGFRKNPQLKHVVSQQSDPSDLARLLPKNIYQDKEFLYSELLQIKQQYNAAVEEITRLKTKIASLEKDKAKLHKAAEDAYPRSTHLRLKMAVGEVMGGKPHSTQAQSVKLLRLYNDKLKRMVKCTDVQYLQSYNKALYDELERLKKLLQEQMSTGLHGIITNEAEKTLLERLKHEESQNERLRKEIKKLTLENNERLQKPTSYSTKADDSSYQKLRYQIHQLKAELEAAKTDCQYQTTAALKDELAILQRELTVEKTVVKGLTEKLACLESKDKLPTEVSITRLSCAQDNSTIGSQPTVTPTHELSNQEELANLGEFLSFKFMAQRYNRSDVERAIDKVPNYTVHALHNVLLGEPFFMNNELHRSLFVNRVTDDGKREPTKEHINRALDVILPEYELLTNEQEEDLYVGCSELITLNYTTLEREIAAQEQSSGTLSREQLVVLLQKTGFSHQQIRFIIGEISFFSDDLTSLNCYAMFDKFYIPTEDLQPDGQHHGLQHSYIEEVEEQFEESMPNALKHEYI